jgi:hypothetical protein
MDYYVSQSMKYVTFQNLPMAVIVVKYIKNLEENDERATN